MTAAPPRVDVVVVNWNGAHFLPACLRALARMQPRVGVIVVDNASSDGSVEYVRREWPQVRLVALPENIGYAGGANAGIAAADAEYVMILNPDVALAPDHAAVLAAKLDAEPRIGAAQGRLYRVDGATFEASRFEPRGVLDSAGHRLARSRMAYDRGQGRADSATWSREASVFSASGAALFLRRALAADIAVDGDVFDPVFFAYKEDVDFGWRARLAGWDVRYVPDAIGWHVRALPGPGRRGRGAPARIRRGSWMNHWLMMIKNDRPLDVLRDLPWVLGWELVRLAHALLRDPALLPAYAGVWRHVPHALRQRRVIQARRRARGCDVRRWLGADAYPPGSAAPIADPVSNRPGLA